MEEIEEDLLRNPPNCKREFSAEDKEPAFSSQEHAPKPTSRSPPAHLQPRKSSTPPQTATAVSPKAASESEALSIDTPPRKMIPPTPMKLVEISPATATPEADASAEEKKSPAEASAEMRQPFQAFGDCDESGANMPIASEQDISADQDSRKQSSSSCPAASR